MWDELGLEPRGTLGRGGFGIVHLAWDPIFRRQVAVKTIPFVVADDPRRLEREVRALAAMGDHPSVVTAHRVAAMRDGIVVVMEYLPGGTLHDLLTARGPLSPADTADLLEGVAAAVDAAHRRDLLHRDIKTLNILLDANGSARLADFGLAKFADDATFTKGPIGTLPYMAPELLIKWRPTPGTDVYALAATAYTLITGHPPYCHDRPANPILQRRIIDTAATPDFTGIPPRVATVLRAALSRTPADRPGTASGLIDRIADAAEPPSKTIEAVVSNDGPLDLDQILGPDWRKNLGKKPAPADRRPARKTSSAPKWTTELSWYGMIAALPAVFIYFIALEYPPGSAWEWWVTGPLVGILLGLAGGGQWSLALNPDRGNDPSWLHMAGYSLGPFIGMAVHQFLFTTQAPADRFLWTYLVICAIWCICASSGAVELGWKKMRDLDRSWPVWLPFLLIPGGFVVHWLFQWLVAL